MFLNIKLRTWRPFIRQAEAFVTEQLRAGHAGIEEGIRWIAAEIASAERPTNPDPRHLLYQAALLRAKRFGVAPVDFLIRTIAAYLADDRFTGEPGPRFGSDQHWAHQLAKLYLHPLPFGHAPSWAKRKVLPHEPPVVPRLRWRVRAYTYDRVNSALGILAFRASVEIQNRQRNSNTER